MLSRRLPQVGGTFIQMEDEIASIAAVCGASLAGVKALTATSGPGFSLMQEMLGFATMAQIPCVVVDVMRGGPTTGLPTEPAQGDVMQARWGTHGEHSVIALVPSSVEECYTLTVEAFNLSEQYRTPVIVLSDALVGHMREAVTFPDPGSCASPSAERPTASRTNTTPSPVRSTTSCRGRHWARRFGCTPPASSTTAAAALPDTADPEIAGISDGTCARRSTTTATRSSASRRREMDGAEVAIFAYGSVARSAKAVVMQARAQGVRVGLVRPITLWPFPTAAVERMAEQVRTVIVPEMNIKQMSWEVQAAVTGRAKVVDYGRVDGRLDHAGGDPRAGEPEFYYHRWEDA